MGMVGADVLAIRNFVLGLHRRSRDIEATSARLTTLVEGIPWVGPDRDRFVQEWYNRHRPALDDVCGALGEAARVATRHADEQERASAAGGAG